MPPQTTQLNYDIVPDKSPLYTTVDQLNQSTADLKVTAQNSTNQPVTVSEILIELIKVEKGADTVQLLLPDSASGIQFAGSVTGPGQATWTVTSPDDGQFLLKADGGGATFQAGDALSFTLQNVVIREGGDGTALTPVLEANSGKEQTTVGIGITQSTLDVQLSADRILIGPGETVTLKWTTQDATSGVLTMPGNTPDKMSLDSTNLSTGQQVVAPIGKTSYSLTCQGRGPAVTRQVMVSIEEVQAEFFGSSNAFGANQTITLFWQTSDATSCAIRNDVDSANYSLPPSNGKRSSCVISATPDGQTLILIMGDGSNQELGRIALPIPCPQNVTFTFTAEGNQTTVRLVFVVNLVPPQINVNLISGGRNDFSVIWDVSDASSVLVEFEGLPALPARWTDTQGSLSHPEGRMTVTCQGFHGQVRKVYTIFAGVLSGGN